MIALAMLGHIGDSRASLFVNSGDKPFAGYPLSEPHALSHPAERKRIVRLVKQGKAEVFLGLDGTKYMTIPGQRGGLAMTRSLGDCDFEPVVSHEPDISELCLEDYDLLSEATQSVHLALYTDGISDVILPDQGDGVRPYSLAPDEHAILMNDKIKEGEKLSKLMAKLAFNLNSQDNRTLITARLDTASFSSPLLLAVFDGHRSHGKIAVEQSIEAIQAHPCILEQIHPK